jgi:hypothetical protein
VDTGGVDTLAGSARYFLVVKKGERYLHQYALRTFARRPYVQVIYDRREADRRRITSPTSLERRRTDRRARPWLDTEIRERGAAMVKIDST